MSGGSISRRDFIALTAVAAAQRAAAKGRTLDGIRLDAASGVGSVPLRRRLGSDAEMAMAEDWVRLFSAPAAGFKRIAKTSLFPEALRRPFSFMYGENESADLLPRWKVEAKVARADDTRQEQEVAYTDPVTGLVVRIALTIFKNFPAVEWVVYFQNTGSADTPILESIKPLDSPLRCAKGDPTIHYAKGSRCSSDDFMPLTRVLGPRGRLYLEPGGGRSSSQFLPFFNIEAKGEGVVLAIGWSGEWAATCSHPRPGPVFQVQAGMALTHLKLHPGEKIRTPRMLALFWQGDDRLRGNNLLCRFLLAHHRPTVAGRPVQAPITNPNWGSTVAAVHLSNIRQIIAHDLPIEYYWIDAGWNGHQDQWWKNSGNWEVNKDLYPQGLKPLSDLLHSSGRKFLLWFEPGRVCAGTPWYSEHAEWLLSVPEDKKHFNGFGEKRDAQIPQSDPRWVGKESARNQIQDGDKLFNLGIPEARRFLTDFISAKIDEFGLDCYRNDENIAPIEFWHAADAPDRQGMTEIRWVEGLYAFWDELLRRHPNLVIDGVSSGSRFLDLETISRSITLTRSDFERSPEVIQCHTYGLLQWVPLNTACTDKLSTHCEYAIRSSMTAGLNAVLFSKVDVQTKADYRGFPFSEVRRRLDQYRHIQKYFYGDFYPLTEYTQARDAWVAYQLDLPDEGEGIVVVVKRPRSDYVSAIFHLKALDNRGLYEIINMDTGVRRVIPGKELAGRGVELSLPSKPDSAVVRYRHMRSKNSL